MIEINKISSKVKLHGLLPFTGPLSKFVTAGNIFIRSSIQPSTEKYPYLQLPMLATSLGWGSANAQSQTKMAFAYKEKVSKPIILYF